MALGLLLDDDRDDNSDQDDTPAFGRAPSGFGMLMDDDYDTPVNFGRRMGLYPGQARRAAAGAIAARSGRVFRSYGDDATDYTWPGSPYATDQGGSLPVAEPTDGGGPYVSGGGPSVDPVTGTATGNTGTGANWWTGLLTGGIQATGQIAGGVLAAATGQCPPSAPYRSPQTGMCYPTLQAAQQAVGAINPGMLMVGALGIGLLLWLGSGKGGPAGG